MTNRITKAFDEFGIENFKSWSDQIFFPIEDITLLFGPNSSGKSSVIQALVLLAHIDSIPITSDHLLGT